MANREHFSVKEAEFLMGATSSAQFPLLELPEIAFFGRSNVGKSSLINSVTACKNLARASKTPGRTQQVNFFSITIQAGRIATKLTLVDLPGFGYAKFAKTKRDELAQLAHAYVTTRDALKIVCILNDSKRLPEQAELELRDLAFQSDRQVLIVATKCDRLNKNELRKSLTEMASAYGLEPQDILATGENFDTNEFWERVIPLCSSADKPE